MSNVSQRVFLTWLPILKALNVPPEVITAQHRTFGILPFEVNADESDAFYALYRDALQYLRHECSPSSVKCSVPLTLAGKELKQFPHAISTLVNTLADVIPVSEAHEEFVRVKLQSCCNSATFTFILAGIRFATSGNFGKHSAKCGHIICAVKASSRKVAEPDLYQAFLIDCLIQMVDKQNWLRDELAINTCMPWSHASLREFATATPSRAAQVLDLKVLKRLFAQGGELDKYAAWTWKFGVPIGIPWFGAPHDPFPFCDTLGRYTTVRSLAQPIRTLRDDAGLWLSAMTFGVLEASTCIRIPEPAVLVPLESRSSLTLSGTRVLQLLVYWAQTARRYKSRGDSHNEQARRFAQVMYRAFEALDQEARRATSVLARAGITEDQREDVFSAVALTVVATCIVAQSLWRSLPEMALIDDFLWGKTYRPVGEVVYQWCTRKMRSEGWCPSVLHVAVGSMAFVMRVAPILVQLPPFIRTARNEHARCGTDGCRLDTFTASKYVPRHTQSRCKCDYIKPPPGAVQQLLSQGLIPVVCFDGRALRVVPARQTPYVAISHVWLEGMGSTTEDGLPSCVIKRIADLTTRILPKHGGAFWMDSLCVPQEGSLRKRAIKFMADTYRGAAKVLVIDDCIRTQCSVRKDAEDNLMYIAASGWMRRVWTLQEGLLARELYFEFAEGPVDFEANLRNGRASDQSQLNLPISVVPVFAIREDPGASSYAPPLWKVVSLLNGRSTSKAEDELIAISSLLPPQINTDQLLAEPVGPDVVERRMRVFLRQLRDIPRNVPLGTSPRLNLSGFSWAPRMLTKESMRDWYDGEYGKGACTEDGLVAEYFVASLKKSVKIQKLASSAPTQWGVDTLLYHKPSKTAYQLNGLADPRSPTIDVLLFLTGDLQAVYTGTRSGRCIAASVVSGGSKASGSRHSPIRLRYITSCTHTRQHAVIEERVREGDMPSVSLGELGKMWVKLT
ncbi:hypothetical protein ACG7TL_006090 [Trametes sanguinea]